jgi:hypothetical protein
MSGLGRIVHAIIYTFSQSSTSRDLPLIATHFRKIRCSVRADRNAMIAKQMN